jgi:hypothetical protein
MELIILNVGLDLGVLSPALFTMFVLMAIVTTLATTPILQAVTKSVPLQDPIFKYPLRERWTLNPVFGKQGRRSIHPRQMSWKEHTRLLVSEADSARCPDHNQDQPRRGRLRDC